MKNFKIGDKIRIRQLSKDEFCKLLNSEKYNYKRYIFHYKSIFNKIVTIIDYVENFENSDYIVEYNFKEYYTIFEQEIVRIPYIKIIKTIIQSQK